MPLTLSLQDMPMIVFMQTGWLCILPQKLWTRLIVKNATQSQLWKRHGERCVYLYMTVYILYDDKVGSLFSAVKLIVRGETDLKLAGIA